MSLQIALQRKFLQAYGTNISFDTRMNGQMIVIVRANGEVFPASVAPIPCCILVDMSRVFGQTTLTCVRTGTPWAHEALANVFSPGVIGQRADVLKRWTPFSALVWFGNGGGFLHTQVPSCPLDNDEAGIEWPATGDDMATRNHLPKT